MTLEFRDVLSVLVLIVGASYTWGQFQEKMQLREWKEWRRGIDKGVNDLSALANKVQIMMLEGAQREVRLKEVERRLNHHDDVERRRAE